MRKDLIKERLSVIYKNRRLQSSKTFVDYEIHDESELSLVTKGRHYDFSIKRKEGRQEEVSLSIFMKREQDFSLEKFRESIYKKLQRDDVSIDQIDILGIGGNLMTDGDLILSNMLRQKHSNIDEVINLEFGIKWNFRDMLRYFNSDGSVIEMFLR